MRYRVRRLAGGMTLIEAVIALFVFASCIAGACAVVIKARELSDTARLHYTAVNLARNRIEQARTFRYNELPYLVENQTVVGVKGVPDSTGDFRRTTTISNVMARLALMTVTVEIRNKYTTRFDGKAEEVSTYLADYMEAPE